MKQTITKFLVLILIITLLLGMTGCDLLGQTSDSTKKGSVSGTVVDGSGNKLTGVTVEVKTKSDTTNDKGVFYIEGLETGKAKVTFTKQGYKSAEKSIEIEKDANDLGEITLKAKTKFVFDPQGDYPLKSLHPKVEDLSSIEEMHLVGEMNNWNPADKTYSLEKQSDGTWKGEFAIPEGTEYKILYDTTTFEGNNAIPRMIDNNLIVGKEDAPGEEGRGSYSFGTNLSKADEIAIEEIGNSVGNFSVDRYDWYATYRTKFGCRVTTSNHGTYVVKLSYDNGWVIKQATEIKVVTIADLDIAQTDSGNWKFSLQLKDTTQARNVGEIHLAGQFQDRKWDPSKKDFALTKQDDELTWTGTFAVEKGQEFKFLYDTNAWNGQSLGLDGRGFLGKNFIVKEMMDYSY